MELNIVYKLAHSFHDTTGIDLEELINEGLCAYAEAEKAFDKQKNVKLTTYLYEVISNRLTDFARKEMYRKQAFTSLDDFPPDLFSKEMPLRLDELNLNKFSKNVRILIETIFNHLDQLDFSRSQKWNKGQILYILEFELGWGQRTRKATISELKELLRTVPEDELFL